MKIAFPYLGQSHQILHSLPIAAELAQRPGVSVELSSATQDNLDFCERQLQRHAPAARLSLRLLAPAHLDALRLRTRRLGNTIWKEALLFRHRRYFRSFDAIVTPERTSLWLKRFGLGRTRLVWTRHGAGDREIGFARDVRRFDFALMAGRKIEQRLLAEGLIRPGAYASGIYAKFDWARLDSLRLFDNDRPTVVYNPHFRDALSSWPRWGESVLDTFARSTRYNLIFAPHVRLFENAAPAERARFDRYRDHAHLLIDLGSERSVDMTYTGAADLYLGDVSSQVAEFVSHARPCVFLNAHAVKWSGDPNYRFWALGPVLDRPDDLERRIDDAFASHAGYAAAQRAYVAETFDLPPGGRSAARAADALLAFLGRG